MSAINPELDNFLGVLTKRLQTVPDDDSGALARTLQDGDAVDLALHTADLDDGLDWLVGTVRTTAQHSPSAAFALATRYAAQHGSQAAGGADIDRPTSGVVNPAAPGHWTATTPTLLGPAAVILLDRSTGAAAQVFWAGLDVEEPGPARRSGLHQAALQTVRPVGEVALLPEPVAQGVARDWDLLTAAVALGIAERAVAESESYAGQRRQFGTPISSFSGLRAILTEMTLQVSGVRAQLNQALLGLAPAEEALATAGRVAVDVCIDAVQVHGGYGYIVEYPVAGLLRDALSIRARGGGRRAIIAQVAGRRLGPPVRS